VKKLLFKLRSRRSLAIVCTLTFVLFLIRPQADRVRWRVSQSISAAIGKRVQIGSLHLRFLPQPGFELEEFVVYDDPAFGSEPLLRAEDVTASLRLLSLLRGHFEVSRLSLDGASLNLMRDSKGEWDLQDLLKRTTQLPTAPTSSTHRESRPEFPYIEASRARINFKIGAEKTHFAFTGGEFSLWQESENMWGMRLKAQPIRTDANLTDTGQINLSGSWQRTGSADDALVEIAFQWKQAQAGQVSKLILGKDKGWRGAVLISGTLHGNSRGFLKVVADTSIDDLGRYDVFNSDNLRLAARCVASYHLETNSVSDVDCAAPAGNGSLELKGNATGLPLASYRFTLVGNRVPAASALGVLRHATAGISQNLSVDGVLNSTVEVSRAGSSAAIQWKGDGELVDLSLATDSSSPPLRLDRVPFAIVNNSDDGGNVPRVEVGPVSVAVGRPAPLQARAMFSRQDYEASVRGEVGLKRVLQIAPQVGIPAPAVSADGSANVDLAVSGTWAGSVPLVTGTAQLRSVRAQVRGLNAPLDIRNANLIIAKDAVRAQNINAAAGGSQWHGSLVVPRPCRTPGDCTLQFNLHSGEVTAASLNNLFNPSARKQSWYKFLSLVDKPLPYLLQARAVGRMTIDKLGLGDSISSQVSGDVTLDQGKLTIANLRSTALGGAVAGEFKADFLAKPPMYRGSGDLEDISLDRISALMHDGWAEGTGSAHYEFRGAGWSLQELFASIDLTSSFAIEDARFPHVVLTSQGGPLQVKAFSGKLALRDGTFSFQDAKLDGPEGIYTVSGTASLAGALKLKMVSEGTSGYDLSGTLTRTRVSQLATATRASLQP